MGTQPTSKYGFPVDPNNDDAVKRHVSMHVKVKIRIASLEAARIQMRGNAWNVERCDVES